MSLEKKQKTSPAWQRVITWEGGQVKLVDQRALPHEHKIISYSTHHALAEAVNLMVTRGACAIGAAGALGMVLAAQSSSTTSPSSFLDEMKEAKKVMDAARPTAVNLSWASARLMSLATTLVGDELSLDVVKEKMVDEAKEILEDDVRVNRELGRHGAALVQKGWNLLHHCNTGRLASVDIGTALGVIYTAHEQGKGIHVWVNETRPRLQGATLTCFELMHSNVPLHLICDNASGHLMYEKKVDCVIYGADRVAANGDVVNKIGTYNISVCGAENKIPVYACVPISTIDLRVATGRDIVIEERNPAEVTNIRGAIIAPEGCPAYNPAFDVTPHRYVTAIITEEGVCYPPFDVSLREAKERGEARVQAELEARLERHRK